jgi:hypothetical protein
MTTIAKETGSVQQNMNRQPRWQRITLLIFLAYEAASCLVGGSLLIAAPNGRYFNMPVEVMHGAFGDFLIPGIVLFALGVLNMLAFVAVLRRTRIDWLMAGLALGGMAGWFIVEIAILQELRGLHFIWGFPVFLGLVVTIPLVALRNPSVQMQKALLTCGILSSLWYMAINILVPMQYEGYSMVSQAPSELSAIGAPTRVLWILLVMFYPLFFAAFGWGVWRSAGSPLLRVVGVFIISFSIVNFYWPPMHQREVLAAGGGTITDTLHIVWASITLLFMMLMMGFGAAALGKGFRLYTVATFVVFLVFGILTFIESTGMEAGLPTRWMGIWERINISAFMLWVIVFAINLLRMQRSSRESTIAVPLEKIMTAGK